VAKKVKAKANTKKQTVTPKKASAAAKGSRPASKAAAKYAQGGAPWWKR